ncbi:MAG: hypothetical protein ACREOG_22445 [Gemmatimonadaceae bacterium]
MTSYFHSPRTGGIAASYLEEEFVMHYARCWRVGAGAVTLLLTFAQIAKAQAWSYPAFQPPRIVEREFNVGVADGGVGGVSAVFQWREQTGSRTQLSLDAGVADPERRDAIVFVGGQFAYMLATETSETPLDFLLTAGANVAIGEDAYFRIPVGVVVGHRFPLEGSLAITPFVHPRLSLDLCNDCASDDTEFGLVFDLGATLELTRSLSIRGSAFFGGSNIFDDDGFGISIAWTPGALARRVVRR